MRELLPLFPKPSHYAGSESGCVLKDENAVRVRLALAFPDLYEVGMSYAGQTILYNAVNLHDEFWAERSYAPTREAAAVLKEHNAPLCTLESDTPLRDMDVVGFHLTHELCFTNVLYMLDLAQIPLRSEDRDDSIPLIIAGGGCTLNAEPVAPFFDVMALGDGEEVLVDLMQAVDQAKQEKLGKKDLLLRLKDIPGIYVPSFFSDDMQPLINGYEHVEKRLLANLDSAPYPLAPPQALDAVQNRYTIEIARGCTRGCRFCHAGMVYRPARERSLESLQEILHTGLKTTGYGETSFLSLSAGDFSALEALFDQSIPYCRKEQISISLPSLRVGSVSEGIMQRIAGIRRTGATLAPEAGSQRLRDVINKGVTEKALLDHASTLFQNGWQMIKLYFMIGLPTETPEDLDAILELCKKVEAAAKDEHGKRPRRLQVTAAISPFVPKPHTPFQWERQINLEEIRERISYIQSIFRPFKRLKLRWHMPEMSFLEGIFARGDRALAPVVEAAFHKNALFSSWSDSLELAPWYEAMEEHGLDPNAYFLERDEQALLPWDHLRSGVTKDFLRKERARAYELKLTGDCRFEACRNCGVCNFDGRVSQLTQQAATHTIEPRCNFDNRDQQTSSQAPEAPTSTQRQELGHKATHYRVWYSKLGPSIYLSQLELQTLFERAMRRGKVPIAFSQGYHPMPLVSFARALPVGVGSQEEYFDVFLREHMSADELQKALSGKLTQGMDVLRVTTLTMGKKQAQSVAETFLMEYTGPEEKLAAFQESWKNFKASTEHEWTRVTRKGVRTRDIRPLFTDIAVTERVVSLVFNWSEVYLNPLGMLQEILENIPLNEFTLTKVSQHF